jgi:hypothetical protein
MHLLLTQLVTAVINRLLTGPKVKVDFDLLTIVRNYKYIAKPTGVAIISISCWECAEWVTCCHRCYRPVSQ